MKNVLEYLEAAAAAFPDKTAVADRDHGYSFARLVALARGVGNALSGYGVRHQAIGVFAERRIETLAFFMGVLYSGNFYVPLDPEMPAQKLRAILDDASFAVICGSASAKERMGELSFDGSYVDDAAIVPGCCAIPETGMDEPLYMVYTSGSTGKPKGVLKSHRAEISYVNAFCRTFGLNEQEIIGNQTPFFFDASGKDIYLMLKLGCTLEILPSTLFMLPPELIDYLNARKITYASWVPTVLSLVAQLNPFSMVKPETLKKIFFVGEVMPMKHLNKWRQALPEILYVNLYGQSEIAGVCCYYVVEGEYENTAILPMGKPLPNCKIYLLDGGKVVTDANHIGELYLVSDALAMEYYHDPEKTAASFLTMDFGEGPVRCFKTGDLAQYDAQGNLLFASRTDFQIKHMGHRIELGEIESVAGALPEVARCCCLYHADKRKIVLFCQLTEGCTLTGKEIQSLLRPQLSSYMLPGKVVILEKIPLNANGKIDRAFLKTQL